MTVQAGYYVAGKFTTLPEQDENMPLKFCVVGAPLYAKGHELGGAVGRPASWATACDAIATADPSFVVLNGGIVPPGDVRAVKGSAEEKAETVKKFYLTQLGDPSLQTMFRNHPFVMGWNDDVKGSAHALKAEEAAMDKAEKDKRKRRKPWEEKVDPRGEMSMPLSALSKHLPVEVEDDVTRHIFTKTRYGTQAEVFTLDTRGRSLGKVQMEWLTTNVAESPCAWKFIVTVSPLAYGQTPTEENSAEKRPDHKDRPTSEGRRASVVNFAKSLETDCPSEKAQQADAAVKIQSRARGRWARKNTSEEGEVEAVPAPKEVAAEQSTARPTTGGGKPSTSISDVAAALTAQRIPGVAIISTDPGQPFAVIYEPEADYNVYEFGVAPLGANDPGALPPMMLDGLNGSFLLSSIAQTDHSTISVVNVAADGVLTFTILNDKGEELEEVVVGAPKMKEGGW